MSLVPTDYSPEHSHGASLLMCHQHGDGAIQSKGALVQVLKHIKVIQPVGFTHNTRTCRPRGEQGEDNVHQSVFPWHGLLCFRGSLGQSYCLRCSHTV